jgi:hypothetical protein
MRGLFLSSCVTLVLLYKAQLLKTRDFESIFAFCFFFSALHRRVIHSSFVSSSSSVVVALHRGNQPAPMVASVSFLFPLDPPDQRRLLGPRGRDDARTHKHAAETATALDAFYFSISSSISSSSEQLERREHRGAAEQVPGEHAPRSGVEAGGRERLERGLGLAVVEVVVGAAQSRGGGRREGGGCSCCFAVSFLVLLFSSFIVFSFFSFFWGDAKARCLLLLHLLLRGGAEEDQVGQFSRGRRVAAAGGETVFFWWRWGVVEVRQKEREREKERETARASERGV